MALIGKCPDCGGTTSDYQCFDCLYRRVEQLESANSRQFSAAIAWKAVLDLLDKYYAGQIAETELAMQINALRILHGDSRKSVPLGVMNFPAKLETR